MTHTSTPSTLFFRLNRKQHTMAKDLPYFKFDVSEWINGLITLESDSAQGLFINICAHYWFKSGNLSLSEIKRRLSKSKAEDFESLIDRQIIKVNGDQISITFLDEQLHERVNQSAVNSANGKRGGRPKSETKPTPLTSLYEKKAKLSQLEEKRREENIHTVECLCSVFGKKYKPPKERLPAEAGFFRDIDAQYPKLLEVYKTDQAIIAQVTAYMKHCDHTNRKRIGTAHKLAETILQSDWIVLTGGNISPPELTTTAYSAAEKRREEWTLEGWEEFYAEQLRDNKFRKHFGYGELRSNTSVGSNGER